MDSVLLSVWQWITTFVGDVAICGIMLLWTVGCPQRVCPFWVHRHSRIHAHMHTHSNTSSIIAVWPALRVLILSWHEARRLPWNCICKSQSPALVSKKKPTSLSQFALFFFLRVSFERSLWIFYNNGMCPIQEWHVLSLQLHMHEHCNKSYINTIHTVN